MKKVKVTLCSGTTCYVLGGAALHLLEENLPEEIKESVEIEGATCLGYCKDRKEGEPPFVLVNDRLIERADMEKILKSIQEALEE